MYFEHIKEKNESSHTPALFMLDSKEAYRCSYYTDLTCYSLSNYDIVDFDSDSLKRVWQRYIYLHNPVYIGTLISSNTRITNTDQDNSVIIDYVGLKGRHKKKKFVFFQAHTPSVHIKIPETTTSQLPGYDSIPTQTMVLEKNHITPEWLVFGIAEQYWSKGITHYQCTDHTTHWEIFMKGEKMCTIRSAEIFFRHPFSCYIMYSGIGSVPMEIRFIVQDRHLLYRDTVIAYLPVDGLDKQRCIRLFFYPELNPENVKTYIVISMPQGGELNIQRFAFDNHII